jgi:hypothetical protein
MRNYLRQNRGRLKIKNLLQFTYKISIDSQAFESISYVEYQSVYRLLNQLDNTDICFNPSLNSE